MGVELLACTEVARAKMKEILARQPSSIGFLFSLKTGGCAGMEYNFTPIEKIPSEVDKIALHGIDIYIPKTALIFLLGTRIDYQSSLFEKGFVFINPNQTSHCGCGKSISFS